MWASRVIGDFPEQGEDTLIPLNRIEAAAVRDLIPNDGDIEAVGADIARFGGDKTIFTHRKGPKVIEIKSYSHMNTMETSARLQDFMHYHPMSVVNIDEVGVGAGVLDRVTQMESTRTVNGINVGTAPKNKEMFVNLRAEIYWGLRERFIDGTIDIPDDEELIGQLANIKFEYTPKGQIKIESKDEMKARGMSSPDKADSLALAFADVHSKPAVIDYMKAFTEL